MSEKSLQSEQVHSRPGTHYNPMQRAKLSDGRHVWIARQNGDGENVWYFTDDNEQIHSKDLIEWIEWGGSRQGAGRPPVNFRIPNLDADIARWFGDLSDEAKADIVTRAHWGKYGHSEADKARKVKHG